MRGDLNNSQGLNLDKCSRENMTKDHMFPSYPLEAFYFYGHTAFEAGQVAESNGTYGEFFNIIALTFKNHHCLQRRSFLFTHPAVFFWIVQTSGDFSVQKFYCPKYLLSAIQNWLQERNLTCLRGSWLRFG